MKNGGLGVRIRWIQLQETCLLLVHKDDPVDALQKFRSEMASQKRDNAIRVPITAGAMRSTSVLNFIRKIKKIRPVNPKPTEGRP